MLWLGGGRRDQVDGGDYYRSADESGAEEKGRDP